MIDRKKELHTFVGSLLNHFTGVVQSVFFQKRLADLLALSLQEGIGHTAADDDGVGLLEEVIDDSNLVGDFCAAKDSDKGALRVVQGFAHDAQFLVDQQAGIGRQISRNAGGGGVGTMHGAEGIRNKDLRHVSQSLGKVCAVLFLTDVEAQVLKKHDLTGLKRGGLGLGIFTDDILGEDHFLAEEFGKALGHRGQGELGLPLSLGLAQVGAGDHGGAVIKQVTDGRECRNNALVAGDLAGFLVLGNVKVAAEQDFLPVDVDVIDGLLVVIHFMTS